MSDQAVPALRSDRAQALINYLEMSPGPVFCTCEGRRVLEAYDVLELVLEPELAQDRAVPIRDYEPVTVSFPIDDGRAPSVRSRRPDFPLSLVHTSVERGEVGPVLCVWEEGWADLRRTLTSQALVERLRGWMSRMAAGSIHGADQPLEPLIPQSAHTLVLPAGPPPKVWRLTRVAELNGSWTVVAEDERSTDGSPFPIFALETPPQSHAALNSAPDNAAQLATLLATLGVDWAGKLREWLTSTDQLRSVKRFPLFIVTVPKTREAGAQVESWEVWAFLCGEELGSLGERLGVSYVDGETSRLRLPESPPGELEPVLLMSCRVVHRLDRRAAQRFSGSPSADRHRLVALGAGALGSNIVCNMMRAGVGPWLVVDNDVVLPHNTVRQAQTNSMVGFSKARTAAALLNETLSEQDNSFLEADVLAPGAQADELSSACSAADLVVDFSASPAVLGRVADEVGRRRGASIFLGPDGADLVVLVEDGERRVRLDELEARYLWAVCEDPRLAGHFTSARPDFIRYANACQDLSRPLPPWRVQTLCGVASGRLGSVFSDARSSAEVWRLDPSTGAVLHVPLTAASPHRLDLAGWRVSWSVSAVASMRKWRAGATPNETGGVLIGSFDLTRSVMQIVGALPAPSDSRRSPTYFIRGVRDLRPQVESIMARSASTLVYVGEWHSHPDGAQARPSPDDEIVFTHLENHLGPTGSPYVMAICGDDELWARLGTRIRERGDGSFRLG